MAAPSHNFEQKQPITTTLRNICQSYPQGTLLRELLQNADDAGATQMEYVLDTNTYPGPFLHSELQDYHGPAVLSRNNAVFTDKDFVSISSVGDSEKRTDPLTTGKFGQGFNSVYHITDGPWILSRSLLLFLDPHHRWSRDTGSAGGPAWNIIKDQTSPAINSHLAAFSAFGVKSGQELQETIIRIPLRTAEQAVTSKIKDKAILVEDIKQLFKEFCQDMESGGMLFLKHIRKITVRINEEMLASISIIQDESKDTQLRNELPADFRTLFTKNTQNAGEVSRMFETQIQYENSDGTTLHRYLIHHLMAPSIGNTELDLYGRSLKLFPWVAVAAPLDLIEAPFVGTLFTTLRLPITTMQPVHLHGLFSIAPDRARLGFDEAAVKWNNVMFGKLVPRAWVSLLEHRRIESYQYEAFRFWPSVNLGDNEIWTRLDESVLRRVIEDGTQVWNTRIGCLDFSHVYFAPLDQEHDHYADALASVNLPAVYLEAKFLAKMGRVVEEMDTKPRFMTPQTVREFLRSRDAKPITESAARAILEFCLQDAMRIDSSTLVRKAVFEDLRGIQCFPTRTGLLSDSLNLILPRGVGEMLLFSGSRDSVTVDLERLSPTTARFLQSYMVHTTLSRRTLKDLAVDWPLLCPIAPGNQQSPTVRYLHRPHRGDAFLRDIWVWLRERYYDEAQILPPDLYNLWLIPLKGDGQIRQMVPGNNICPTLVLQPDSLKQLIIDILPPSSPSIAPVLDDKLLGADEVQFIGNVLTRKHQFSMTKPDDIRFIQWLAVGKGMLRTTVESQRNALLLHLDDLVHRNCHLIATMDTMRPQIAQLPLFSLSTCVAPYAVRRVLITSLENKTKLCELPQHLPPLPNDIGGLAFVEPSNAHERNILRNFNLVGYVSNERLLRDYLIPWLQAAPEETFASVKMALLDWVFVNSKLPNEAWANYLRDQQIIPLSIRDAAGHIQYGRLSNLVAPDSPHATLYFNEEAVFPDHQFYQKYKQTLWVCGIGDGFHTGTMLDRARVYSKYSGPVVKLKDKVECLLRSSPGKIVTLSDESLGELRSLKWVPGISITGEDVLLAPNACRGKQGNALVDHVWGTTSFWVEPDFQNALGWDQQVPVEVLLQQLDHCVEKDEKDKVDKVLKNLMPGDSSLLLPRSCILGVHGHYLPPFRVFCPGHSLKAHPVSPYIDRIDASFGRNHIKLLKYLQIKAEPSIQDLRVVQDRLVRTTEGSLAAGQLLIAIATLEIATTLHQDSALLASLLIPDTGSVLREFTDIVQGDLIVSGDMTAWNFTNAAISRDLNGRLGVEDALARRTRLGLDMEGDDEDQDEYAPKETYINSIRDTLGRYTVSDTFNEFLSNAEDACASKISWCLDECSGEPHAAQQLLTPELKLFQGPALFVHNDGVFTQQDFDGFKSIGQGGQRENALSIGRFGRGSMSISASYIVLLDPQQSHLTLSTTRRRRKVGLKVRLGVMRRYAPDQLEPYDGLFGFDKSTDHYNGTLFRLPLRNSATNSSFEGTVQPADSSTVKSLMQSYLNVAKISLLFLSSVSSIEFTVRGQQQPGWSVHAQRSLENEVFKNVTVSSNCQNHISKVEWRLGILDVEECPASAINRGKGHSKATEVGVAAFLRHGGTELDDDHKRPKPEMTRLKQDINHKVRLHQDIPLVLKGPCTQTSLVPHPVSQEPRHTNNLFCKLPTPDILDLPISIHGSFAITGDRKSIIIEGNDDVAKWNRWLLTKIEELYVQFLHDLSCRIGEKAFQFWPSQPSSQSRATISGTLAYGFWSRLMNERKLDQLYPLVEPPVLPSSLHPTTPHIELVKTRRNRKLHPVMNIEAVHFDALPDRTSALFRPLFLSFGLNLCRPPSPIRALILAIATGVNLKVIDSNLLCQEFKKEENCAKLERFLAGLKTQDIKGFALALLYNVVMPKVIDGHTEVLRTLEGCRILPKLDIDMPLGMLSLADHTMDNDSFLVATLEEENLFSYATNQIMNSRPFNPRSVNAADAVIVLKTWQTAVTNLVEGPCNIRKLGITDVGKLLADPRSPSSSLTSLNDPAHDEWNVKLWKYINSKFDGLESVTTETASTMALRQANICDHAVYRYKVDKDWKYITPRTFSSGPCIVEPAASEQKAVCASIPGLICVDSTCLPTTLRSLEGDLSHKASFARFLKALSKLRLEKGQPVQSLFVPELADSGRLTLRQLWGQFLDAHAKFVNIPEPAILRALPIWSRARRGNTTLSPFISAENAHFCPHRRMFMEWVGDLDRHVDPIEVAAVQGQLQKLGIPLLSADAFWPHVKRHLPQVLDAKTRADYLKILNYLQSHCSHFVAADPPNGNGVLCKATSLYDHDEEIFTSAFREQQAVRFVHLDLWPKKDYWRSVGLRTRRMGELTSEDYLESCQAASGQSDPFRHQSLAKVAAYLDYEKAAFRTWPQTVWSQLSRINMFSVNVDVSSQLQFRRARMAIIAQGQTHCSLERAGQLGDIRIIWSQLRILERPPAAGVFNLIPSRGRPPVATVLQHLLFLVGSCRKVNQGFELAQYLEDVKACYGYLQSNLAVTMKLPNIRSMKVWFNVDTTLTEKIRKDDLLPNLLSASEICLDAPDDYANMKVARKLLIPFESLLKALGCETIVQPELTASDFVAVENEDPMDEWMSAIRKFRDDSQLTDVVFEAEKQKKPAHKVFLAAASDYCKGQFLGAWGLQLKHEATIIVEDISYKTLSTMIDFAYSGLFKGPELSASSSKDEVADRLDDLLDLLIASDRWLMSSLHEKVDAYVTRKGSLFVRPDNVGAVMKIAADANARRLLNRCQKFRARNINAVEAFEKEMA